ncbi:MAG: carboxypeptidase regulatory-like domain-containing protein [Pseudomonadota bacterium]|nr:carboxypeptidase regulatory-like domain-containing protein [Pseudomonadota bacterium]
MSRAVLGLALLLSWLLAHQVQAQPLTDPALQRGATWLQAQVQAGGTLASEATSPALPMQARAETALTLRTLSQTVRPALFTAIDGITPDTTEYLARKALARQLAGTSDAAALDALATMQNPDGGFGAIGGQASNPQDTAWALRALAASRAASDNAARALAWMATVQQADGRWLLAPDGDAIVTTALAVQALAPYRQQPAARAALTKARAWLLAQRNAQQAWGEDLRTAHALLAVLPGLDTAATVQAAVDALRQSQRTDGSWAAEAHLTALALRAIWLAAQPATNPDLASIAGHVVDEAGQPIVGAAVRLTGSGLQTESNTEGRFSFVRLNAGQEQLDIQATGFRPLQASLNLQPGQQLDLGTLRLSAASGGTSVTLQGVARYFTGTSHYAASNALIQVGSQSVRTDRDGNYRLDGLSAGAMDIAATYSSYPAIRATVNAVAGQVVDFSPVFQQPPVSTTTLLVTVTDEAGQPVPSATVTLQNTRRSTSGSTDSHGQARFTSHVVVGTNEVTVFRAGYERVVMQLQVQDGQQIQLDVVLRKPATTQTTLRGTVTDNDTRHPLADATVRLEGTAFQTRSNAAGEFTLTDRTISGSRTVVFEKPGYLTHRQSLNIGSNVTTVLSVPLRPAPVVAGPAQLEVSVQVRGTGAPLAGAQVALTGANLRNVQTDTAGRAAIANLNPGDTHIQVSALGHEAVVASMHVKTGQRYALPVELLPTASAQHRLHGQIVDAVSQMPIAGAQVVLTGTATGTITTAANGAYEFSDVPLGGVHIEVTRSGYAPFRQSFELNGTTEASIALIPAWQAGDTSTWQAFGTVVDADTLEPLAGAQLQLEEVLPGTAVTHTQTGVTALDGRFAFSGLTEANARVFISLTGYDSALLPFARQATASQSLGTVKLKRSYNAALPDLMVSRGDRSALVMDPHTFRASGVVSAVVTNNSNHDAGSFNVIAFLDTNGNQLWDEGVDTPLASTRIAALPQQQSQTVAFDLKGVQLPFRDAPIHVMADSGLEVIENIEGNNTLRVGVSCAGGGGGVQDVAVCIDTSGSVSHLYNLEMEGVIKAVENPNIIPHDGSIRFTLGTDREMCAGQNPVPLHPATVVEPATLPQLIQNLKDKRQSSGCSSGSRCTFNLSKYLLTLPQQGARKTLITVGDGYWEGIARTEQLLPQTIANGVSRVDVIGVGNVNLRELEANAWPKPHNTLHGGQVTVAYSAGEVAAAMAQALGAVAQTIDLTLGNFRLLDQGTGQPVRLSARVGNAGSPSQASSVRFYQGTRLLGEAAVPALKTGEWVDVALPAAALTGTESLVAVVDEARANAECNLANNRQQIDLAAANALALLKVQTDQPVYSAHTPVGLGAAATNRGNFAAALELVLTIEDSQGAELAHFGRQPLGTLVAGATQQATQPWNTGQTLAGSYVLRGRLFDTQGNVVAQDSAPFAIVAGDPAQAAVAALTVSTDKGDYTPNDVVLLGNLASNLAANAIIDAARVSLIVRNPQGTTVFTHEHALGQMPARALRELQAPQRLNNALLGTYTVEAVLHGRGPGIKQTSARKNHPEVQLARASTAYRVLASGQTGTIAGLSGTVTLAKESLRAGEAQSRDDWLHNTSGVDFPALKVLRVVATAQDGREIQRQEHTIALSVGGRHAWQATPIATAALQRGSYSVLLLAEVNGQLVALDQKAFNITADNAASPGQPGQIAPVPTTSPATLALLALLLALATGAARKNTHRRANARAAARSTEEDSQ